MRKLDDGNWMLEVREKINPTVDYLFLILSYVKISVGADDPVRPEVTFFIITLVSEHNHYCLIFFFLRFLLVIAFFVAAAY